MMEATAMPFAIIERSPSGQVTVVNTDQITYLRQDSYGTTVHFSSGEHVNCTLEIDALMARLSGAAPEAAESLLIKER
jgi:hypothetical protein